MSLKDVLEQIDAIAVKYHTGKPYIVGGLPRDIYMKNTPLKTTDIDLTTNSPEILRLGILVADDLNVPFELSDDGHLTVYADDFDLDFSSNFISDQVVEYLDGKYSGIREAFSRDFTINTLHQDLTTREILDPTGLGFNDINKKVIRTPVPAKITLTDDPRRAYRAINLAARYGFTIDDDIKNFVLENPELFKSESIKDKYIAVKISKALKEDEEYTLTLLKELGLFKNIPLSGHFKDVLIARKMLTDYLSDTGPKKYASKLPADWLSYAAQGPEYRALGKWWIDNYSKMPGNWDQSYDSWTTWYMDKYHGEWESVHKNPLDTIIDMNQEAGLIAGPILEDDQQEAESIINNKTKRPMSPFRINFKKQPKSSTPQTKILAPINVRPGVDVENVTQNVKDFLIELGSVAKELGATVPIITSGWRSLKSQARIMAKNWKANGGLKGGRKYLVDLYGPEFGGQMATIFEQHGTGPQAQDLGLEIIKSRITPSQHVANPGRAVDIAVTNGIKDVLDTIKLRGKFNLKVVNETNTAGPHWHVSVLDYQPKAAAIKLRKETVKKFGL